MMYDKPLLTIATINWNNSSGVARTIASLAPMRRVEGVQFIFQDGLSSDESISVARLFYNDDEIVSCRDSGIYHAMNLTLARARGSYIVWINSGDEILSEQWLAIRDILRRVSADLHMFSMLYVDVFGRTTLCPPNADDVAKRFSHPAMLFRVDFLRDAGGYQTKFRIAGDFDLVLRMARMRARIYVASVPMSVFYAGGASSSSAVWYEAIASLRDNDVISMPMYIVNFAKFVLVVNVPALRCFRLKLTSVVGPERVISLYDLGAIKAYENH
jgi:glycosyltransferase involved in cell wall biosynthesis